MTTAHPHQHAPRRRRGAALAAAVCVMLSACATPAAEQPAPDPVVASGSSDDTGTITVSDDIGPVEVPVDPQRIVTLVDYAADLLASFDRVPVAAQVGTSGSRPEYLGQEYVDVPSVGNFAEPSLEAIAEQKPDLIIGLTAAHAELRDQLSAIAPTMIIEPRSVDDVVSHVKLLGDVLGEPEQARSVIKGLQADDAPAAASEQTCLLTNSTGEGISLLPPNTVTPSVMASYCTYAYDEKATSNSVASSIEQVLSIDPDQLFVAAIVGEGGSAVDQLAADPLWGQLTAVRTGQVHEVDPTVWLYGRGPQAINEVQDQLSGFVATP